jgi:hypothetical protein
MNRRRGVPLPIPNLSPDPESSDVKCRPAAVGQPAAMPIDALDVFMDSFNPEGHNGPGGETGLLVLGHGSQSAEADEIFAGIVERVREISRFKHVAQGSLQLSRPTFAEGVQALLDAGVREMVVMPMFIFRGNHVKFDIPDELESLRQKHPGVRFVMADPIGADPRLADIIEERAQDAQRILN